MSASSGSRGFGARVVILASLCAVAGFGSTAVYASHLHTANLWYHGIEYGTADAFVHVHAHSSDGAGRTSYVAGGLCAPYNSHDGEQEHLGANNGIDKAMGSVGEQYAFASVRSPQTSLGHHHHSHYYSC